jgi:CHASE2 domain-containing sensor protein
MGMTDWLLKPLGWLFARHPSWRDAFGRLLLRVGSRFYWALALLLALAGAWDLFGQPFDRQLSHASFDWLMRHRPIPYTADPDIVVLNIDEASLAALAPQYGRWPWPRAVLAEVAAKLEQLGARAVVFDILFSDPDVTNPDSEAIFDHYVAASRRSFYASVRLNPRNDAVSQISVAMLNFSQREPKSTGRGDGRRTIALVPPYFKSIYDSTRVGTNNIYPDEDNVVRWFGNFERLDGYRIPSLPYRMAQVLGWPLPQQPRNLLNWPMGSSPYTTVSFADALRAARAGDDAFFGRFAGKVVLVGSTAPSLNDLKATPVDSLHPGIYVLATAVDNIKRSHFLRPLSPAWIWAFEALMLAVSAHLFARTSQALAVTKYFFFLPAALLAISLASISSSDLLVDLSVPAAIMLAYFTVAKLFDTNTHDFIAGSGPYAATPLEAAGRLQIACLPAAISRQQVLSVVRRRGVPIKLWDPVDAGLGAQWARQGWVLWRWNAAADDAPSGAAAPELDLHWFDVTEPDAGGGFSLAQAIATAAATATPAE